MVLLKTPKIFKYKKYFKNLKLSMTKIIIRKTTLNYIRLGKNVKIDKK